MTITRAVTMRIVDLTLDEMSRELPGGAMGRGLYDGWGGGGGSGKGDATGYCTILSIIVNGELVHTGCGRGKGSGREDHAGAGSGEGDAYGSGHRDGYSDGAGYDKTIASK